MNRSTGNIGLSLTLVLPAIAISAKVAHAQPITAELNPNTNNPTTGTLVAPNPANTNQFDITGGTQAGTNLFHSFEQFGLDASQIANFISNPDIQNILGRVVGGNPSAINGLIQVTSSGTPNLFLMNPAGIIFGANASLNVPADFTATTATSIGFGSNWFNATGANDYASLVGNPNTFAFTTSQPGSIINSGNLTVSQGNLMLLGGTVANTGQLSAPGGQITIASVPGENLVNITQDGLLLSLEIRPLPSGGTQPGEWTLPISSLPELLTGGNAGNATELIVNNDGTVSLTGSGLQLDTDTDTVIITGSLDGAEVSVQGSTIGVGDISSNGGNITFNADGRLSLGGNIVSNGGDITLSYATLVNDVAISTGENVGGNISVNGFDSDSSTTPRNLTLTAGTGNVSLNGSLGGSEPLNSLSVSGATITADLSPQAGLSNIATLGDLELQAQADLTLSGNLEAGGNLRLESQQGNLILTSSGLQASGNIELLAANTVQIRDSEAPPFSTQAEGNLLIQGTQAIDIEALDNPLSWFLSNGNISLVSNGNITSNGRFASVGDFSINQVSGAPANFTTLSSNGIISAVGNVSFGDYTGTALKVEATGSITAGNIRITQPNPSFLAGVDPNSPVFANDPDIAFLANSPALILRAGLTELWNSPNIPPDSLGGGTFTVSGEPSSPGNINVGNINTNRGPVIFSATGDITTGAIRTGGGYRVDNGSIRGFVDLVSGGDIEVQFIDTRGLSNSVNRELAVGGDITIAATGLFRATGYIITKDIGTPLFDPEEPTIVSGSALGGNIPAGASLTSINASALGTGGKITIQHGGSSFVVGPRFELDPVTGNVIFRTIQTNDDRTIVLDADGNIAFGEQVFYTDANGDIEVVGGSVQFRDGNGNTFDGDVAPVSRALTVADLANPDTSSFTAGTINSGNNNGGVPVSFRDRPFTTNLATGSLERIQIRFAPPNNSGSGTPDVGGIPSDGGVPDSNGTTGSSEPTSSGNPGGGIPDGGSGISDFNPDDSGSSDSAIATQAFELQDERSPQQRQQLQLANQCRNLEESSETPTNRSDRPDDEDCEELELIPQPSTQPRLLRIELQLPPEAPPTPHLR